MRYIELSPERADMVKYPDAYHWFYYQANAQGKDNDIINYHLLHKSLGKMKT